MTTDRVDRPNYAEGQFLGASDFVAEQEYQRDALRRMNLSQHTWGIFAGLELVERPQPGSDTLVDMFVQPGLAVDGFGRPIVVFYPHKLDPAMFAQPLFSTDQWVQVWIRYATEQAKPPQYGYEVCSSPGLMYRTHEIFCIDVGPVSPQHDKIVLTGVQTDDAGLPLDLSVPEQGLPEDVERFQWRIPIGWVHWNGVDAFLKSAGPVDDRQRASNRAYGGAIADKILAQAGLLRIADRSTATPLPADRAGVGVTVEGSLVVDRTVSIGTTAATFPLSIQSTGPDEDVMAFEDSSGAATWAINQKAAGSKVGLNFEDSSVPATPASRLFLKRGGNVGVGTTTPTRPLSVRATGTGQELVSFEDVAGSTKWHINQLLGGDKPGLNFVETGVADGRLFLAAGGSVGIGTVTPGAKLDVAGDVQWGGSGARLSGDQGGSLELGGNNSVAGGGTPYIDFHFRGKTEDFNVRLINDVDGRLSIKGDALAVNGTLTVEGLTTINDNLFVDDIHASGTVFAKALQLRGVSVPVDVVTGSTPIPVGGSLSGKHTFPVPSRLSSVSDATIAVALANIGTGGTVGQWAVSWLPSQKTAGPGANEFTFTVNWSRGDLTDVLAAIAFVAVFVP